MPLKIATFPKGSRMGVGWEQADGSRMGRAKAALWFRAQLAS